MKLLLLHRPLIDVIQSGTIYSNPGRFSSQTVDQTGQSQRLQPYSKMVGNRTRRNVPSFRNVEKIPIPPFQPRHCEMSSRKKKGLSESAASEVSSPTIGQEPPSFSAPPMTCLGARLARQPRLSILVGRAGGFPYLFVGECD